MTSTAISARLWLCRLWDTVSMQKPVLEIVSGNEGIAVGVCSNCNAKETVPPDLQKSSLHARRHLEAWFRGHKCSEDVREG